MVTNPLSRTDSTIANTRDNPMFSATGGSTDAQATADATSVRASFLG